MKISGTVTLKTSGVSIKFNHSHEHITQRVLDEVLDGWKEAKKENSTGYFRIGNHYFDVSEVAHIDITLHD